MTVDRRRRRACRCRGRPRSSALMSLIIACAAAAAASSSAAAAPLDDEHPPTTMTWTPLVGYPGPGRHHPITFANETHAFLLTGSTSSSLATSDFYLYEESSGNWTDLSGTTSAPPPGDFADRSFGYGVVLNEDGNAKAYLGMGADSTGSAYLGDLWEFDMITHEWRRLADLPGPGRRHPAMNAVMNSKTGRWEIHVGLGDGIDPSSGRWSNLNDWWIYDVYSDAWRESDGKFPSTKRHHPFYFSLGGISYAGLGHSAFGIERDFYSYDSSSGIWTLEGDFASYNSTPAPGTRAVTTEARVAGTQFAIELPSPNEGGSGGDVLCNPLKDCPRSLGFVLSGDGDDHGSMETGEFHAFYPAGGEPPSDGGDVVYSSSPWWRQLPPHPGRSRWAPGSFVMRGTARAYFTSGRDRTEGVLHADLWRIDLSPLFGITAEEEGGGSDPPSETTVAATTVTSALPLTADDEMGASTTTGVLQDGDRISTTTAPQSVAPSLPGSLVLTTTPPPPTESADSSPGAIVRSSCFFLGSLVLAVLCGHIL